MALTRVELENFTAFTSLKLDLCSGINVLVGANGTGKTHLMKVCYAAGDASGGRADDFANKLVAVKAGIVADLHVHGRRTRRRGWRMGA